MVRLAWVFGNLGRHGGATSTFSSSSCLGTSRFITGEGGVSVHLLSSKQQGRRQRKLGLTVPLGPPFRTCVSLAQSGAGPCKVLRAWVALLRITGERGEEWRIIVTTQNFVLSEPSSFFLIFFSSAAQSLPSNSVANIRIKVQPTSCKIEELDNKRM